MCSPANKPLFRDLNAEDPDPEATEIESLCMNCHENGVTRLLLTKIPHYKDVVIMSFTCEHCGYHNNEIQSGGAIADKGVRITLKVTEKTDLNRQCIKSDYTSVRIQELDFEIPAQSQKGEVTTVEGIITRAVAGLSQDQEARRQTHPEDAASIDSFIGKLSKLLDVESNGPFTLVMEDISGNCHIENPFAPQRDPRCAQVNFRRSKEQDHTLGIFTHDEVADDTGGDAANGLLSSADPNEHSYDRLVRDEIMTFRTNCPDCNAPCDTNMKVTSIPHFKDVVIMATTCESCGHRTNEVKSGGGIEEKGVRFEVRIAGRDDFTRDILKSETCSMSIPELELEVGCYALGGRFTTTEGLIRATAEQLGDSPELGDSTASERMAKIESFVGKLNEVLDGKRAVTIVLDDPAGNSYVQSLNDDGTPDDGLVITRYERTYEQNEELGLNDMNTDNYQE